MDEIERRLKRQILEKDLEDFLLNLLLEKPTPEIIIKVFSILEREGKLPLPDHLFFLIYDYLVETGLTPNLRAAIEILKRQSKYQPQAVGLRKLAIEILKTTYPVKNILLYIAQSHLDGDRDINEGIEEVENFIRFDVGKYILGEGIPGLGRIIEYQFLLEKVVIDSQGVRVSFPIPYLFKNFIPLPPDHFLVLKEEKREELKKMAEENPFQLFLLLLKSFHRIKLSEVKKNLSGIIDHWDYFWERVRKELTLHPQIRVIQEKERVYEWSESEIKKPEGNNKKPRELREITALPPQNDFIATFSSLDFSSKKELLKRIKEEMVNWREYYREAFLFTTEERLLNLISAALSGEEEYERLLYDIFTGYRFYPFHFYWLIKYEKARFEPKALFFRVLDLLTLPEKKEYFRYFKRLLKNKVFIEEAISEMSPEERSRIRESLQAVPALLDYEKDEIKKILERRIPKEEIENVIYNTEEGIKRVEEELKRLITVELKESSLALARARSFGDLAENYEYKIAKEKHFRLMNKIEKLKEKLKKATPIVLTQKEFDRVEIGTRVKLKKITDGQEKEWTILGPWDIDLEKGVISYLSPLGKSMIGKRVGERITAEEGLWEIIEICRGEF